ncbi:hypothetical protein [Corallococcus carmarthensis]|uniref:hypothetical protein n=1 Tax=Corallococcus carmarthensis TaxID=2316728 RepID=UPI0011C3AD79|nr:hypothetical protein [Corallococcus carmarthensis]NOK16162.1 hypothetical protein [Corallococcus carmarthensis]
MRLSVIAALLSVGFFAGCGGMEEEPQDAEVTGQNFTQCWNQCVATHQGCLQAATTPDAKAFCDKKFNFCVDRCESGTVR